MEKLTIVNYTLGWDLDAHGGIISLQTSENGWLKDIVIHNSSEFQAIADLLRHEAPLFLNEKRMLLYTKKEPVGEGE